MKRDEKVLQSCENCTYEQELYAGNIYKDELGVFTVCNSCESSYNINLPNDPQCSVVESFAVISEMSGKQIILMVRQTLHEAIEALQFIPHSLSIEGGYSILMFGRPISETDFYYTKEEAESNIDQAKAMVLETDDKLRSLSILRNEEDLIKITKGKVGVYSNHIEDDKFVTALEVFVRDTEENVKRYQAELTELLKREKVDGATVDMESLSYMNSSTANPGYTYRLICYFMLSKASRQAVEMVVERMHDIAKDRGVVMQ